MGKFTYSISTSSSARVKVCDFDMASFVAGTGGQNNVITMTFTSTGNDANWEIYVDPGLDDEPELNDLVAPGGVSAAATTTGGTIPNATQLFFRVTALNAIGESPPSIGGINATTTGVAGTNKITVSWSAVSGATSYNIYGGSQKGRDNTLIGNSATTSLVVTSVPTDSPVLINTTPTLLVAGKKGGVETIPLVPPGISSVYRLVVFGTPSGSGAGTLQFTCVTDGIYVQP